MQRWCEKVAVVTGASAGIGQAIAHKLVANGMQVVGLARRQERLDELEEKLSGLKGKFFGRKTDVSKKEDIIDALQWTTKNVGPPSLLVNNAGIISNGPVLGGDLDGWKALFDTNIYGLAVATSEVLKIMKENNIDDGHIININSICGHRTLQLPDQNVYPASKYAVTAFTEVTRKELAAAKSKIRVTSISPGLVHTEIFAEDKIPPGSLLTSFLKTNPILQSEDVADAVIFAVGSPAHVQISELTIQPTGEMF
ncbi:farnesol dehydrogenase-like [Anthonomus grandis grandis]|uniref:farnesol dehydrogenase-like n=1 Tax=Anthonomus grandis grandis TaxID=2921223 RepID=UPI00216650E3|nr:farnesol dehydrogenase-like [Anthonomus grandis grandis]